MRHTPALPRLLPKPTQRNPTPCSCFCARLSPGPEKNQIKEEAPTRGKSPEGPQVAAGPVGPQPREPRSTGRQCTRVWIACAGMVIRVEAVPT